MEIAIVALIGIVLKFLFGKKETKEEKEQRQERERVSAINTYLNNHPNPNQEDLIRTVFSMAEKDGGLWHVSFGTLAAHIYSKNGREWAIGYSELGYGELSFHHGIWGGGHYFFEFPYRLKRAAEDRGYLYWTTRRIGYAKGSSYTSYDGGNSYSRDDSTGEFISGYHVCSKEYYRINQPYPDPNVKTPPLKKL